MQFSKDSIRALRAEIDAALRVVAEKHGISLHAGSASFQENEVTFKLRAANLTDSTGQTYSREAEAFRIYAPLVGLKPEDFGRAFTVRGERYSVAGYNPKARAMPILARRADGKTFKFAPDAVVRALGGTK